MRKLLVSLVLLVIVLGVVDRVAVAGAEREIARQIAALYDLPEPPSVQVKGIPFITQAISGRYEEIAIGIGPVNRLGIKLSSVDATVSGVTAPLVDLLQDTAKAEIRAERVTGTVVISRDTLSARAPRGLRVEGNGGDELAVSGEVTVLGRRVPVTADLKVEVSDGAVRLVPANLKLAGGVQVPRPERLITFSLPVKNLPLNMRITRVRTTSQGLEIKGTATDVRLK